MNRKAFYDAVRHSPFDGSLTQSQVDGTEDVLDAWERLKPSDDLRWLGYILAGVYHETGGLMVPVREGFAKTDAEARAVVAQLYAQGRIKTNYALPVNGISYYGRGRIQNTHLTNYQKLEKRFGLPFVTQPDLLLDPKIDAEVTIIGHVEGLWTGKKLADYFNPTREDPINARRIVNGTDKAALIAGYYDSFLAGLRAAADMPEKPPAEPVEPQKPVPAPPPLPERSGPVWDAYTALAGYFGDPPPAQERKMVAGAIIGLANSPIGQVVQQVIIDSVVKAARQDSNAVQPAQAPAIAVDAAQQAAQDPRLKEIVATVEHATNNEPAVKSRVAQGSVGAILVALATIVYMYSQGTLTPEAIMAQGAIIVGGLWALWGRFVARKPVGA